MRKHGVSMVGSIPMKGMGENYKHITFEKTEPTEILGKTTLEQIMQEMSKIVYSPVCFPGAVTELTRNILFDIGFHCMYSSEENITVIAKRN
jgi:hypothetical protein